MARGIRRPRVVSAGFKSTGGMPARLKARIPKVSKPAVNGVYKPAAAVTGPVSPLGGTAPLPPPGPTSTAGTLGAPPVNAPFVPGAPEIRDSTYSASLAGLLEQVQKQRAGITQQGADDETNVGAALRSLATRRGDDHLSTMHGANRQGLLYSGILGKRQGDVDANYDSLDQSQRDGLAARKTARARKLDDIGNLAADKASPYGYTATGGAGKSLANLLAEAARRRAATLTQDPVADEEPEVPNGAGAIVPPAKQYFAPTAKPKAKPKVKVSKSKYINGHFKQTGSSTKGF